MPYIINIELTDKISAVVLNRTDRPAVLRNTVRSVHLNRKNEELCGPRR